MTDLIAKLEHVLSLAKDLENAIDDYHGACWAATGKCEGFEDMWHVRKVRAWLQVKYTRMTGKIDA